MGLFSEKEGKSNKEKGKLPSLPHGDSPSPPYPDNNKKGDSKEELPPLPSFPSSKTGNKVSNHAAKQEIESGDAGNKEETSNKKVPQKPESKAEMMKISSSGNAKTKEMGKIREEKESNFNDDFGRINPPWDEGSNSKNRGGKEGPVYVRLDNFEDSKKELNEIKKLVNEVDKSIKEDIKDLKKEEEKDIEEWEKEINKAKSLLKKIDSSIFKDSNI